MTQRRSFIHYIKWFILATYVFCFVGVYLYMYSHGLSTREFVFMIRRLILEAGWMGPFAVFFFYVVQSVVPFPTIGLAIMSGALYGPVWGSLLSLFGLNVSGMMSFLLGRFFGRHIVAEHEGGWFKKYDESLKMRGFLTVFLLRVFMFPFDFVGIGCGMTTMPKRHYLIGTFLGIIPGTLTFVWLGEAFHKPQSWRVFMFLLGLVFLAALWLRRSSWAQKTLFATKADKKLDEVLISE